MKTRDSWKAVGMDLCRWGMCQSKRNGVLVGRECLVCGKLNDSHAALCPCGRARALRRQERKRGK